MVNYLASSGFFRPDATGEKPLRATVWFSIEHAPARDAYVKRQMTSLSLDSRENYDLCARPGFGWSWPKIIIMSCTTPQGSPKRLLNPNNSPKTPITKGSSPSSSKNCLVCGIILIYALSSPVLLSAFNAILQTTVQFPLVKDDQRRVCKSCFRRLELTKYKKKRTGSTRERISSEVQQHSIKESWNHSQHPMKRLAKDSPQDRDTVCHLKFRCKWTGKKCTRTVLFASNYCKAQEDIYCFPLEYEEEKENSFPGCTGSAPSENTCENKPDISKDEIKVKWFI